ncbi:MAG: hypothetical protein JNM40_22445 [Myxococcales bacterium]|nr:hypothetical protein [Myxococcales bacterium]
MTQPTSLGNVQALVGSTQGNTYTLERLIHEGGRGALFEAKQIRLGSRCAVRLLGLEQGQRKPLLGALSQQAQVHHPGLISAIDTMLLGDDRLLIATPLLGGQDLAARVAGQGKLSLAEGLLVLRATAGALYALHQRGLCHGGLHARNIFLARFEDVAVDGVLGNGQGNQRVCLLDAGLYLARGQQATPADDQAALSKIISETVSDIPPPLAAILAQAQHPTVSRRFPSLQALWLAAESAQGRKAVAAQQTALVGALRLPTVDAKSSRWPMLLAAGSFLVLAAVIAAVGLRKSQAATDEVRVVAKASVAAEQVTIVLELSPGHASVSLDGKPTQSPLRLNRSEQAMQLLIEADGYQSVSSRLIPDRDRTVHISLAKVQPQEPVETTKKRKSSRKK